MRVEVTARHPATLALPFLSREHAHRDITLRGITVSDRPARVTLCQRPVHAQVDITQAEHIACPTGKYQPYLGPV
jgi:hypothetical protein